MDLPLVSIITPSFNQGMFIRETIESVLNQEYPNIEYIIIDGGSTDDTHSIVKSYGDRIKLIVEEDDGQSDAVNKGIRMASGTIIGWLNSDDTYLPGAIKTVVQVFMDNPEIKFVYGEGYWVDKQGCLIDRYPTEPFNRKRLAQKCFICQPTAFIKREVFDKVGLLDVNLHFCMDYDLWFRITNHYRAWNIPQYLATSRLYPENKTMSSRLAIHEEAVEVIGKYNRYIPINWIFGLAYHRFKERLSPAFFLTFAWTCLKLNRFNILFLIMDACRIVKDKMEESFRHVPRRKSTSGQHHNPFI